MKVIHKVVFATFISTVLISCGNSTNKSTEPLLTEKTEGTTTSGVKPPGSYDPKRGEGKFDATNVKLGDINSADVLAGKSIAETKCLSCHKTTEEKLVGPGWQGVTKRRQPHWIMNFITNPDPMIDKDPEVQAQLELCLVRMPNQDLNDGDARKILEFMRENDLK